MSSRNVVLALSIFFVLALLQLLTALASPWAAIAGGIAAGLLLPTLVRFFGVEWENPWVAPAVALAASAVGVLIAASASQDERMVYLAFAPPAALLSAGAIQIAKGGGKRCGLCERRVGGLELECPRCGLYVGEQCCWVHERLRCRLCEQNEVPAFPVDKRWWDQNFGPRVDRGHCQITLEKAEDVDLRPCRRCQRTQSIAAWDLNNGQCARCGWVVEELPERLGRYMGPGETGG